MLSPISRLAGKVKCAIPRDGCIGGVLVSLP